MSSEKIKRIVLSTHRSIREFCVINNLNYSTFMTLLKTGFESSNVGTAIQVARALGVSCEILASEELLDAYLEGQSINQIARDPIFDREGFRELITECRLLNSDDLRLVTKIASALNDSETLTQRKQKALDRLENQGGQPETNSWLRDRGSKQEVR